MFWEGYIRRKYSPTAKKGSSYNICALVFQEDTDQPLDSGALNSVSEQIEPAESNNELVAVMRNSGYKASIVTFNTFTGFSPESLQELEQFAYTVEARTAEQDDEEW